MLKGLRKTACVLVLRLERCRRGTLIRNRSKVRIKDASPLVVNRHDRATVDTNLTGVQDRIDLVEQNGKLQQSLQGLGIFQLVPKLFGIGS